MHQLPVDTMQSAILKDVRSEAFLIRLENKTFRLRLSFIVSATDCKPFPQFTLFCNTIGLPNTTVKARVKTLCVFVFLLSIFLSQYSSVTLTSLNFFVSCHLRRLQVLFKYCDPSEDEPFQKDFCIQLSLIIQHK